MTEYSNPRMQATIPDWPSGSQRVTANFYIETDPKGKKGERAVRETTTTKKDTYADKARIVDGDDGKIYIIKLTDYGICVKESNMKFSHDTMPTRHPQFDAVLALF